MSHRVTASAAPVAKVTVGLDLGDKMRRAYEVDIDGACLGEATLRRRPPGSVAVQAPELPPHKFAHALHITGAAQLCEVLGEPAEWIPTLARRLGAALPGPPLSFAKNIGPARAPQGVPRHFRPRALALRSAPRPAAGHVPRNTMKS
jgi:hypothetical protein